MTSPIAYVMLKIFQYNRHIISIMSLLSGESFIELDFFLAVLFDLGLCVHQ